MYSAYLKDHRIWPRGGAEVNVEVLVPQRVLCGNLIPVQLAHEARCPAYIVTLEHSTEHLAHDLRRQLDPKRTIDAVAGEVEIFRLAIHIHRVWVWEHAGL
jgi:hypothetical protein